MLFRQVIRFAVGIAMVPGAALAADRAAPLPFAFDGGKYGLARQTTEAANKVAGWMFGWHVQRIDQPLPADTDAKEALAVKVVEAWLVTKPEGYDCSKQDGTMMHGGIAKDDGTVVVTYQCNAEK